MPENHSKYHTILWLDRILCQKNTPNITPFYGLTVFYVRKPLQISHHFMALPTSMLEITPNISPFYGLTVFYVRKPFQITHHFMARPYSMSENHSKYHTILWLDRILCSKTTPNITPFYGFTVFYVRQPLQISQHFMASPCSMSENHSKYHTILWLYCILCQKTTPNITPFYGFTVFYVRKPLQISHHFMALPYSMSENHSKYHTILWLDRILCQKTTSNITPFYGFTVFYVRNPHQISHHFMA